MAGSDDEDGDDDDDGSWTSSNEVDKLQRELDRIEQSGTAKPILDNDDIELLAGGKESAADKDPAKAPKEALVQSNPDLPSLL